jgi:manganese/zinc/iron transport system ATP- binding protein
MNNNKFAVEVTDLTVAYRERPVLWDIDLEIPPGVLMAIVGPNGAGKTTLLKAILGLLSPAAGQVLIYGKKYSEQRRLVGYVPQRGSVDWDFPTSVLDVVMMGRYGAIGWIRRPRRKERGLAMAALEKVGMQDFARRQISQLSGGQQQRVFLARALVQDASVYFMDEPFQGVDATPKPSALSFCCFRNFVPLAKLWWLCTTIYRQCRSILIGLRYSMSGASRAVRWTRPLLKLTFVLHTAAG